MPKPLSTRTFTRLLDRYARENQALAVMRLHHSDIEVPLLRKKERKAEKTRLKLIEWALDALIVED